MIIPALNDRTFLTVDRLLQAPRERVFRAWTEPEALVQWFRPGGLGVTVKHLDLRIGGRFCFELADGHDSLSGSYLEIVRPERLVFTWSSQATHRQESLVTIEFLAYESQTRLILTHARLSDPAMCSLHQAGWQILLRQLLWTLAPVPLVSPYTPPFLCISRS